MSAEKLHSGCSEKTHPPADRDLIIYITYSASRTILLHNARRRGGRRERERSGVKCLHHKLRPRVGRRRRRSEKAIAADEVMER